MALDQTVRDPVTEAAARRLDGSLWVGWSARALRADEP
jgi:hypothetical protein